MTPGAASAGAVSSNGELDDIVRLYESDHGSLSRFYNLSWSPVCFDRLEQLDREWQKRLETISFDALNQQGRIDYLLLRNELQAESVRRGLERRRLAEMEELLPFRAAVQDLERARWRMEAVDPQAAAGAIAGIPEQAKALRKRIEKAKKEKDAKPKSSADEEKEEPDAKADEVRLLKVSPVLAKRAAAAIADLRGTLKNWFSFYDGYQPDFSWWLKKPYNEAATALEDYAKFLREEVAGLKGKEEDPLIGDPVGWEVLEEELAVQMIPYTPEELIAIGEREFAWCQARMQEASQEMGLDWKAALAKVKAQFVPPGKQDELVAEEARRAVKFVKDRELITVPPLCEETWRVALLSAEAQKGMPYAAYGGQNIMVAYAKEEMKHEDKLMSMRGNNRHFMHIVTAHELIPGHHLQHFVGSRHRAYRAPFTTPFLVEGWALYWEMRLWDLGYGQSPEERLGMLFWRMHRSARIIVSLKFHLGRMTPAEMVDFLVDRVGHERLGATSEVRRYIGDGFEPLYQCAYMLGGLQLRALRQELVGSGKMTEKQFHDTVLSCSAIPIELIRAGMLDLPLTRNTRAQWKFAGDKPASR